MVSGEPTSGTDECAFAVLVSLELSSTFHPPRQTLCTLLKTRETHPCGGNRMEVLGDICAGTRWACMCCRPQYSRYARILWVLTFHFAGTSQSSRGVRGVWAQNRRYKQSWTPVPAQAINVDWRPGPRFKTKIDPTLPPTRYKQHPHQDATLLPCLHTQSPTYIIHRSPSSLWRRGVQ